MAINFFLHLKLWYNVRSVLQLTRVAFNCMKVVLHVLEQGIGMCVLLVTLLLGQHWRPIYNMGTWCGVTFNSFSISLFSNLSSKLTRILSQWEIIGCLQNTSILSKDTAYLILGTRTWDWVGDLSDLTAWTSHTQKGQKSSRVGRTRHVSFWCGRSPSDQFNF